MSESIIDIVHRLSYQVSGEEKLKQVTKEMDAQIARTDQLTKRMFTLSNLFDKTTSADVERRQRIKRLIDETSAAIDVQAKAIEQSAIKSAALVGNVEKMGTAVSGTNDLVETLTSGFSLLEGASAAASVGISLGFTALLALLPKIIDYFTELSAAETDAAEQLALYNKVIHESNKIAAEETVKLDALFTAATDKRLSTADREKAAKALQKEFPERFANLKTEIILNGQASESYKQATKDITDLSRAKGSLSELDRLATEKRDAENRKFQANFRADKAIAKPKKDIFESGTGIGVGGSVGTVNTVESQNQVIENARKKELAIEDKIIATITARENQLKKFAGSLNLAKAFEKDEKEVKEKVTKTAKEITDIYFQEKAKLDERLASITASTLVDEETIRAKVKATFDKTIEEINRNLKDGKLTKPEAADLRRRAGLISDAELEKEFKAYHAKQQAAQEALNSDIEKLQQKHMANMIALLKDDFEMQAKAIELNNKKQKEDLQNRQADDIAKQEKLFADGIYGNPNSEAAKQKLADNTQIIIDNYSKLYQDVDAATEADRTKLSQKIFEKGIEGLKDLTEWALLHVDEDSAKLVKSVTQQYLKGEIDYKKYQDVITDIARHKTKERLELIRDELQSELNSKLYRLEHGDPTTGKKDDAAFIKKLQDEIKILRAKLAQNSEDIDKANVGDEEVVRKALVDKRLAKIAEFESVAQAAKESADSIIADEQRVLDAQIAIQTKRVEAAQRIADRGNAQLLEREEKRLRELQKKRDNAAKAELVTNNLLTISNAVLAVAKAAAAGFGYASVATVAAVIAALVAGYSAVRTLTNDTGGFKEGGYTGDGNTNDEAGVVHKKEFVMHAKATEKYRPLLEEMNKLRFHPEVPKVLIDTWTPNYLREQQAAANHDYRKSFQELRKELNEIKAAIIEKPNTSVTMDREGIAISVEQVMLRRERNRNL